MINYRLSLKFKLLENDEFNHFIIILIYIHTHATYVFRINLNGIDAIVMHRETKTCMQLVHIHTNMNLLLIAIFFFFFFIAQRANVYTALILKPSFINRVGYLILSMRVAMNGPFL